VIGPAERQPDDGSLIAAVVDVLDAGQRVLVDRLELAIIETRAGARSAAMSMAFVVTGLGLLLLGWVATNAVGILLLGKYLTEVQAFAVAALVNFAAGGGALLMARARAHHVPEIAQHNGRTHVAPAGGTSA
jgi:hypothetical protein